MQQIRKRHLGFEMAAFTALFIFANVIAFAQKSERISATAMGTSAQLGQIVSVDFRFNEYSNADERTVLLQVFQEKGSQGLANALHKMKSKGRIAITGTLGFDVNYIRLFEMPDGSKKIRFVTDRPITFGEAWASSRSMDYSLSMGEIIVSKEKGKSTGTLYPASELELDKNGELHIELLRNPWKLTNIKEWK